MKRACLWGLGFFLAMLLTHPAAGAQPATGPASQPAAATVGVPTIFILPTREANFDRCVVPARSLMQRELIRQAVLIAARDEAIGEPVTPAAGGYFDLEIIAPDNNHLGGELSFVRDGKKQLVWKTVVTDDLAAATKYEALTQRMEEASRTDLPDALKKYGLKGAAPKAVSDAPLPDSLEEALGVFSVLRQLDAARQLHQLIKENGASPALLGGLARAYANLGQLTNHIWDATPEAYRARSLLYARRLVVLKPKSPLALWQEAYAFALAGLHQQALGDLADALKLAKAAPGTAVPPWLDPIETYLHYNTDRLLELAQKRKDQAHLASLLAFLTVDFEGTGLYSVSVAETALSVNPRDLRVLDGTLRFVGVSLGHTLTEQGLGLVPRALIQDLSELPGAPAAAREAMPQDLAAVEPGSVAKAAAAFRAAAEGDTGEPSWAAFGHAVSEQQFLAVFRRAYFMRYMWRVDTAEFATQFAPAVEGHRFAPLIELFATDRAQPDPAVRRRTEAMSFKDLKARSYRALFAVAGVASSQKEDMSLTWQHTWCNGDSTALGLGDQVESSVERKDFGADMRATTDQLGRVSPFCPLVAAARIDLANAPRFKATDYFEQAEAQPLVQAALARFYVRGRDWEQARLWLKKFIAHSPDPWAYDALAEGCLKQNDEPHWLEVMEAGLQAPDVSLAHARTNVTISEHFMKTGRYAKAQPYAEAAAKSWASWAMSNASDCYEGLEQWDKAEEWVRNISERYAGSEIDWYEWCVRTGHGDLDAARQHVLGKLQAVPAGRQSDQDLWQLAAYYSIEGKKKEALQGFEAHLKATGDPEAAVEAALLAADLGDPARRDALLAEARRCSATFRRNDADHNGAVCVEMFNFIDLLQRTLAAGDKAKVNLAAVDKIIDTAGDVEKSDFWYFTARYLAQHGDAEGAKRYYRKCVRLHVGGKRVRTLAYAELRKAGVEPMDIQREMIKNLAGAAESATKPAE